MTAAKRVWRANDRQRGHDVAVKLVVDPNDTAAVRRLIREGEALARVVHDGVVRVLDVVTEPPAALVLDLIEAPSLRARLDEELVSVGFVQRLAIDIAEALSAAHAQGVAHRDLKPDNILVTPDRAVLVDFGIAAPVASSALHAPLSQTTTMSIHGTPAYLAPELVEGGAGVDAAAADRYALGVVLLECLLGDNPYRAPTVAQTLACHVEQAPPSPSHARHPGQVPDDLATDTAELRQGAQVRQRAVHGQGAVDRRERPKRRQRRVRPKLDDEVAVDAKCAPRAPPTTQTSRTQT